MHEEDDNIDDILGDDFIEETRIPQWAIGLALLLIGVTLIFAVMAWSKDCPVCQECPDLECAVCPECNITCPACPACNCNHETICPNLSFPNLSIPECPKCPDCNVICNLSCNGS